MEEITERFSQILNFNNLFNKLFSIIKVSHITPFLLFSECCLINYPFQTQIIYVFRILLAHFSSSIFLKYWQDQNTARFYQWTLVYHIDYLIHCLHYLLQVHLLYRRVFDHMPIIDCLVELVPVLLFHLCLSITFWSASFSQLRLSSFVLIFRALFFYAL